MILDVYGFYKLLEVEVDAQPNDIRVAHRRLSRIWHPDINPSATATETMAKINEAFRVLSDPVARYDYDRLAPPPPQITTTSSSVHLGRLKRKAVVSFTSERPISDVSCDYLNGNGWEATIRLTSEYSLDVIFIWTQERSRTSQDFMAAIDGTPVFVSVTSKSRGRYLQLPSLSRMNHPISLYFLHLISFYLGLFGIYFQVRALPLLQFSGSRDKDASQLLFFASLGLVLAIGSYFVLSNVTNSLRLSTPLSYVALFSALWCVNNGSQSTIGPSQIGINIVNSLFLGSLVISIYKRKKLVR